KQTQEFIDRFRYKASKARQVQSRVKQLDKIEIIEVDNEEEQIRFRFPQPAASGRVVLELKDISKSYGENKVFTGMQYKIERGDRVAIVGVNGAGKSTFSRIVAGAEPFDKGQRIVGHNVTASYFAQDQAEELDASREVIEVLDEVATGDVRKRLRAILGSFLFHGDDVFKKISMLSGGEKSRVALARMLLQPANFLIMDEPTNHLDMRSKKVLQSALQHFEGTYLIVSHDRAFLEPIVNKVLEFRQGEIKTYLGSLKDYLRKKSEENTGQSAIPAAVPRKAAGRETGQRLSSKEERRRGANSRKEHKQGIQPLKRQVEALEEEIRTLESAKENLETSLADPELYKRGEEAKAVTQKYNEVKHTLELKYSEWTLKTDEVAKAEKSGETRN
ncbi:MAG: ABC-F family ATP-binding cassette domain-containing protein, partial [Ignavibacteriales bacterium]|nr:ABC-F family ATP-binding cassette domain-containing protein [Ignavibacteriales bacterium]